MRSYSAEKIKNDLHQLQEMMAARGTFPVQLQSCCSLIYRSTGRRPLQYGKSSPLHWRGYFQKPFLRIVSQKNNTISRLANVGEYFLLRLPHSTASCPRKCLLMGIRLLHHRSQNHAQVNDCSNNDYQSDTAAGQSSPRAALYALSSLRFTATAPRMIAGMEQGRTGIIATHPRHGKKESRERIPPTMPGIDARMVDTVSRYRPEGSRMG